MPLAVKLVIDVCQLYSVTCLTVATQQTFFYKLANQDTQIAKSNRQVTQQRIIEIKIKIKLYFMANL